MLILRSAKLHWANVFQYFFIALSPQRSVRVMNEKESPRGDIKLFSTLRFSAWENEKAKRCEKILTQVEIAFRSSKLFAGRKSCAPMILLEIFYYLRCFFLILQRNRLVLYHGAPKKRDDDDFLWGAWLFFIIRSLFLHNEHSIPLRFFPFAFVSLQHLLVA